MKRRHAVVLAGVLGALLAFPAGAAATTNEPIAQAGGMEATLPLLGTSLTVGVTLDATGNIAGVSLNPLGTLSKTSSSSGLVTFASADGKTTVKVRAGGSRLTIGAKTARLADLEGTGSWRADVFGTGAKSSVAYTIGHDSDGHPRVAIGVVNAASGITATVGKAKAASGKKGSSAAGRVTFARNGFVKHLLISVKVSSDGKASLKITLSGKDRQTLSGTLAELAGSRTWSAHLCDGTPVTVSYHVTTDGDVVYDGATGAPATAKSWPGGKGWHHGWLTIKGLANYRLGRGAKVIDGFIVRFDKTRVGLAVILVKRADGSYALLAKGASGSCRDKKADKHGQSSGRASGGQSGDVDRDGRDGRLSFSGSHGGRP